MSKEYDIEMYGHPSLIDPKERKLNISFSTPNEINEDTGILLNIAGFGWHKDSNVHKKMRSQFADKFNLVVIQCNYFGWEFMQSTSNFILPNIDEFSSNYHHILSKSRNENEYFSNLLTLSKLENKILGVKANLQESESNYCEMGIIQAIDNISAILLVKEILRENDYRINKSKVIVYGNSQGAYLGYLVNRLAPNLVSLLIDNSSWIYPQYIDNPRYLYTSYNNQQIEINFDYAISNYKVDSEILNLNDLYKNFDNISNIISFHGAKDTLISFEDKYNFIKNISNSKISKIDDNNIDGIIFKNSSHGLNADFLKLFEKSIDLNNNIFKNLGEQVENLTLSTNTTNYVIDYSNYIPQIQIFNK